MQSQIVETYHDTNGVPGYRMMCLLLKRKGYHYSNPYIYIYNYMKELGLRSITRHKKPNYKKEKSIMYFLI